MPVESFRSQCLRSDLSNHLQPLHCRHDQVYQAYIVVNICPATSTWYPFLPRSFILALCANLEKISEAATVLSVKPSIKVWAVAVKQVSLASFYIPNSDSIILKGPSDTPIGSAVATRRRLGLSTMVDFGTSTTELLLRLAVVLGTTWSLHITSKSPNPIPRKEEKREVSVVERQARYFLTSVMRVRVFVSSP